MMFGFGKSKRIATAVKDIQMAVLSQSYIFAGAIAEEVDAVLSDTTAVVPMYKKIITQNDDQTGTFTCLDQIAFSNEAMAFYLNVLARTCYATPKRESAGIIILKPSILTLLELFAKAAHAIIEGDLAEIQQAITDLFWDRDARYGNRKSLLGANLEDKSSAWQEAGRIIAVEAQPDLIGHLASFCGDASSTFLQMRVRVALLKGVKHMELSQKVASLLPDLN